MKKFVYTLSLLFICFLLNAQPLKMSPNADNEEKAFFATRDSLFADFELGKVPTGLLKEYGVFFEDPAQYNGKNSDAILNSSRFGYLLAGMRSATVSSNAIEIPFYRDLKPIFEEKAKTENLVLLPMLFIEYNKLDTTIVSVSGKKIEKTYSKKTELYLSNTLFAVSPSVKKVQSLEVVFELSTEYFFSNLKINQTTYKADFGDGNGETIIKPNVPLKIRYDSSGKKHIKFAAIDQSGTTWVCHSSIEIEPNKNADATMNLKSVISSTSGSVTGRAFNGGTATVDYNIVFSGTDQILDKPFIFVEGFDPFNSWTFANDWMRFNNLRNSLLSQGYDLVLVNYQNSTDYIQRNAYALEELIKNINQTKNQYCFQKRENVIMGLSMGGLVARYALTDMENLGQDHDTRLYISYDSPHQGANIPLGFQMIFERLAFSGVMNALGLYPFLDISQLEEAFEILKSPAAQQMLILGGLLHDSFYNELNSMGYPSCRNIALTNGSMQGVLYPTIQYGSMLAELDFNVRVDFLSFPLNIFSANVDCYALANNSNSLIYSDNLGVVSWTKIKVQSLPYDNAPGGTYEYSQLKLNPQYISSLLPGNNSKFNLTSSGFSFVPTASALGITLSASTLQASVSSSGQTPFDNIFINPSSINENHIELTADKMNWILQQISIGDVIDCDASCFSVSGPSTVCSTGATFTIPNLPAYESIFWETGPNLTITSGQSTNSCIISASSSGSSWVRARLITDCDSITLPKKNVWVGNPKPYWTSPDGENKYFGGGLQLCQNSITSDNYFYISVDDEYLQDLSYSWTSAHSDICWFTSDNMAVINPCNLGFETFHCEVTNQCGSTLYFFVVPVVNCRSQMLALEPNPTSSSSTISISTEGAKVSESNEEWELEVYSPAMLLQHKIKIKDRSYQMHTEGWKDGVYYLKAKLKNDVLTGKLIVKH